MKIDPEVLRHVEKFVKLAYEYADDFWKGGAEPGSYGFVTKGQRKYVIVNALPYHFKVNAQTGEMHCSLGRRYGHRPNIRDFVKAADWRKGNISVNGVCVPVLSSVSCDACGGTENVGRTKLGLRCRYCRAADTRHVNTIRHLGGTPMINGRPLDGDLCLDSG